MAYLRGHGGEPVSMRRRILAGALAAAMLAGCSSAGPANPIDGLITGIEGRTLTLRTVGGDTMEFEIADPTVPVDHLRVHQGQKLPVRITWTRRGERLVATTIADAPPP